MCSMNAFMAATLERLSTGSCDRTKLGANTTARLEEVILLRHDESMTCVIKQSNQIQPSVKTIRKRPAGASNASSISDDKFLLRKNVMKKRRMLQSSKQQAKSKLIND